MTATLKLTFVRENKDYVQKLTTSRCKVGECLTDTIGGSQISVVDD